MSEDRALPYPTLPCPFCGSRRIFGNTWSVGDEDAAKFDADEFGEVRAFECSDCLAGAPVKSWNNRAKGIN